MASETENWEECPAGSLQQIAVGSRAAARKEKTLKIIGASTALCLILAAGYVGVNSFAPTSTPGKIQLVSCGHTLDVMDHYFANELGERASDEIEYHLTKCDRCREKYEMEADRLGVSLSLALNTNSFPVYLYLLASR